MSAQEQAAPSAVLPAAAETGGIEVRVYDASGKSPVPGASVTLSSALGMVGTTTVTTGAEGLVSFPVLRPGGGYAVEVAFPGFARVRVSNEVYPALLRGPAPSAVPGVLYLDVSASDLATLDRFEDEGNAYSRIPVSVELDDASALDACAYLFLHSDRVDASPWEPERFEAGGLEHFVNTYVRDRAP